MLVKKLLYKSLSFKNYLIVLSSAYFVALRTGLLRGKKAFDYPYFLPELIGKGDTVIDIGANLGYYSVPIARILRRGGHLHAVEPVAQIREVLKRNLRKFDNVTIYPYALGYADQEILMGNDSLSSQDYLATGVNMVLDSNTGADHAAMEFHTEMRRGSELFKELGHIDFIKCDIEGYEVIALGEMMPLIEKHRPTLLVETGGAQRKEMTDLLGGAGYLPYVLRDKKLHEMTGSDNEDILFIHAVKMAKYKKYIDED